ncbi:BRCA2-interacting transcriptional repressor EMSY [Anopheles nili]|uniref:BRCA2-interacting transcriptional repressor EMSY n=1 Tax=Anopheles nili TaxID=185578 RepID=UPI00237B9B61|nr:BRCA2-interacting transcriptional repressor EMSY [Anopheles nili]
MWPMKLDMTREECRGVLRRLELESYGTVISTFRAQGCLSKEKQRMLEELRRVLHISTDRHRAEARRVANDERLTTVAEVISGPNSAQDWRREGHRQFPILPRGIPHTALTYIANTVYEQLTRANCKLPHPAETSSDRLRKAEEEIFDLVRKELSLFENGFKRDAAVVTSDPFQDIMTKSYINREVKRAEPAKPEESESITSAKKENSNENVEKISDNPPPQVPDQPSLCDILLNNTIRPDNMSKPKTNNIDKIKRSGERSSRKKTQSVKRAWKSKSPYPPAKMSKHSSAKSLKQSPRNSLHSPHLIHSYAVPFDSKAVSNGCSTAEPLQLQQHLTSGIIKSHQHNSSSSFVAPLGHQQGILPSSKKDIQYNLSKLNPTSNLPLKGGNLNIPMKGISFFSHGKHLPQHLLNYQKKSPSKNILIPTSTAAATLASLGLPKPLHPPQTDPETNSWISSKNRDASTRNIKRQTQQHDSCNVNVIPTVPAITVSADNVNACSDASNADVPSTDLKHEQTHGDTFGKMISCTDSVADQVQNIDSTARTSLMTNHTTKPSIVCNISSAKQPNLAGFTVVKSGNKLSVHKAQLLPLGTPVTAVSQNASSTPPVQKNNVIILPKPSTTSGMLNLGQKITIPKSIDSSASSSAVNSPPKVIVQTVPNIFNVSSFEMNLHQKATSPTSKFGVGNEMVVNTQSSSAPMEQTEEQIEVVDGLLPSRAPVEQPVPGKLPSSSVSTVSGENTPIRKIKISPSQLIPFKGTLYTKAIQPTESSGMNFGAKKVKIELGNISKHTAGAAAARGTDWEHELDRTNSSHASHVETASNEQPSSKNDSISSNIATSENLTASVALDQKVDPQSSVMVQDTCTTLPVATPTQTMQEKLEITVEKQLINDDSKSSHSCLSPSHGAGDAISHGEYDIISTERGDDSSVTDSAAGEDDLEDEPNRIEEDDGIEEDDYDEEHTVDVEIDSEAIIIEEVNQSNYDTLIEEVSEEDHFTEEAQEERMEFISVGYGTTRELVAELESTSNQINADHPAINGVVRENLLSDIQYHECSEEIETVENGEMHEESFEESTDIVCDLLEMDADGKYHALSFSYEQVVSGEIGSMPKRTKRAQKVKPSV